MAGWFARLMQRGRDHTREPHAISESSEPGERDTRYDEIVQLLRDRKQLDRDSRERRQRWYRQHLRGEQGGDDAAATSCPPARLNRFRTKVPCVATPEARTLLHELRMKFSGSSISFSQLPNGRQALMIGRTGFEPRQIGWVEHCPVTDPKRCNVRHQGLSVETDDGVTLALRFRYPATSVKMGSRRHAKDDVAAVDFAEVRTALDLRPYDRSSSPRLVWITRPPEEETMNAVRSRDYEAFYSRFKLEVLGGIWNSLSAVLAHAPDSQWHQGSYYTVIREPDATLGRIHQRTVDDTGRAVDIGSDRIYDAFAATDILLLYLDGDILADFADIYFALQSLGSADAYFVKEEFFRIIRRFWSSSGSLASGYGSDVASVIRMSQRAVPMPAQQPLLKQDWTSLRQSLVDRYGERGAKASALAAHHVHRPRTGPSAWSFASFPAGDVNIGLRLVYRQEWATIELGDPATGLETVMDETVRASVEALKWPRDVEGTLNMGARSLAATTDTGLEAECRESSGETTTRLSDVLRRMARIPVVEDETAGAGPPAAIEPAAAGDSQAAGGQDGVTRVYRRLYNEFAIVTRPAEIQNVVMIAEKLPAPADIDLPWVRRHAWILAKVLLDESFRDTLETIAREEPGLGERRDLLYEHVRANVLHYQRAIWQQEDPQQRCMRYRKSGRKLPLEWRFELESGGAWTIDELCDRLAGANVDAQFAAYASGREADVDQLIDPAGPVGYYANYAIYHMRPELGSADLFPMLHFFKSPWLRPNPETGEAEVADPAEIAVGDDPVAMDRFRDERTQRVALDTGRVVIDVVRNADTSPALTECIQDTIGPGLPDGYQLVLEGVALLRALARSDRDAEGTLLVSGPVPPRLLSAGSRSVRAHDVEIERVIVIDADGSRSSTMLAGTEAWARERVIAVNDDAVLRPSPISGGQGELHTILAQG